MRRQRSGYLRHKYQKLRLARHLGHFGYMLLAIIIHLRIRSAIRCSRIPLDNSFSKIPPQGLFAVVFRCKSRNDSLIPNNLAPRAAET
jgi:hypothetical protein